MVRPNEGNGWHHAVNHEGESRLQNPEEEAQRSHFPPAGTSAVSSPMTRKRAMSVASAQPSVETVVSKAKRAASTLWTLLHAQV